MKRMKELRQVSQSELKGKLEQLRKDLMKANAQISTGTPPENPGKVRLIKKTIARINFILNNQQEVKEKSNARN